MHRKQGKSIHHQYLYRHSLINYDSQKHLPPCSNNNVSNVLSREIEPSPPKILKLNIASQQSFFFNLPFPVEDALEYSIKMLNYSIRL